MPVQIHSTAIVDPKAEIGNDVAIGPYCIIGPHVTIGSKVKIEAHTRIDGFTKIGEGCRIFSHAVVGTEPQDLKFKGEETYLEIGKNTIIREFVTVNRGTKGGGGITKVGDSCFLMAYVHIAHDCCLENNVILGNAANLAGHILIASHANIGGLTGIHQFVKIGEYVLIGGCSAVSMDVPPYAIAVGNRARILKVNNIGLERKGFSKEAIAKIKKAYRYLLSPSMNTTQALVRIEEDLPSTPEIQNLLSFIRSSERGICK